MYYVVDNYTLMVEGEFRFKRQAQKELRNIGKETGLYIYSIFKAKDRAALNEQLAEIEATFEEEMEGE